MRRNLWIGLLGVVAVAGTDWTAAGRQWWKHVEFLASDQLEGRELGSAGYDKAADYVAAQFERAGLKPGGQGNYFQPVQFTKISLNTSQSSLALIRGNNTVPVPVPAEAQLGYNTDTAANLTAPVVFAGYGLCIPEAQYNDLEGLPLQGAVVAFLTGGPDRINGNLRSHYSSLKERWRALRTAGAVGIISIPNPAEMEIPWSRQSAAWGKPHMSLSDPGMASAPGLKFSASWNPEKAEDLFAGSGHTFAEILQAAKEKRSLPRFALNTSIQAHVSIATEPVQSKNVVGIRPGSDPERKNEFVALSAHLDHLGTGTPVNGDRIYNGAMDDASGVASLIEIARHLSADPPQTARSLIFIAVTGEEKGELGSEYFAAHPTASGKIVADLNMDMFLPLFPLHWLEVQGLNESTLGEDVEAVAEAAGVKVQADKEPNRNRFIRSDQYSFVKKGVPAVAFKFGFIPGGEEEKIFKDWYTHRYHGVSDDTQQPVDLAAAAQFNEILKKLALRVADAAEPPAWKSDSFFRRFAAPEQAHPLPASRQ
ncbi:MAG: M20/M25/M40 family metallo-hydrolase [Acidobacteriaceae bacterium]|nr:M20/M25/M40 family metallo-hydrolase [Acidobacteriaceae bacterium]